MKIYSKLFFNTENSTELPNIGRILTGEVTPELISDPPNTKSVEQVMKVKEMNEVEGKQKNKTDQHEDFYINGTKGEKITPENCHKEEKKGFEKKKKKVKSKMRKELTDLKSTEFGTQV